MTCAAPYCNCEARISTTKTEATTGQLTLDQLAFFKTFGYLLVRGCLQPALMARARARLWDAAPDYMRRDEPDSWVGPVRSEAEDAERNNYRKGFRWQYRAIGTEPWMIDLLPADPRVWAMTEQLLGCGQVVPATGVRGIYCTLPYGNHEGGADHCHVDAHPFHLGVVGYIDDVDANGGGFRVWPGSHRAFYHDFTSAYCMEPTADYEVDRQRISALPSVDCHGRAGDIIFWHHRLGHMASHNRTRRIRQAVLYDFSKKDLQQTKDQRPADDMWTHWSTALQQADVTAPPP